MTTSIRVRSCCRCQKLYSPNPGAFNQKYCSAGCAMGPTKKRVVVFTCRSCNQPREGRANQLVCSQCYSRGRRGARHALPPRPCVACGAMFNPYGKATTRCNDCKGGQSVASTVAKMRHCNQCKQPFQPAVSTLRLCPPCGSVVRLCMVCGCRFPTQSRAARACPKCAPNREVAAKPCPRCHKVRKLERATGRCLPCRNMQDCITCTKPYSSRRFSTPRCGACQLEYEEANLSGLSEMQREWVRDQLGTCSTATMAKTMGVDTEQVDIFCAVSGLDTTFVPPSAHIEDVEPEECSTAHRQVRSNPVPEPDDLSLEQAIAALQAYSDALKADVDGDDGYRKPVKTRKVRKPRKKKS